MNTSECIQKLVSSISALLLIVSKHFCFLKLFFHGLFKLSLTVFRFVPKFLTVVRSKSYRIWLTCYSWTLYLVLFFAKGMFAFQNLTSLMFLSRVNLSPSRGLCFCLALINSRHAQRHAPTTLQCFLLTLSYRNLIGNLIVLKTDHLSLITLSW